MVNAKENGGNSPLTASSVIFYQILVIVLLLHLLQFFTKY